MTSLPSKEDFIVSIKPMEKGAGDGDCSICTEELSAHRAAKLEKCGHVFCHQCIMTWFESGVKTANTCPMCRATLFVTEEEITPEQAEVNAIQADFEQSRAELQALDEQFHADIQALIELLESATNNIGDLNGSRS